MRGIDGSQLNDRLDYIVLASTVASHLNINYEMKVMY